LIVGGADGCRTGWVICRRGPSGALDIGVVKTLAEACEGLSILAVDMPIGFVDHPRPPRACEVEARKLCRARQARSSRRRAAGPRLHDARRGQCAQQDNGRRINQQTFHLFPRCARSTR
jgi:predicted RNase H-like nuclease